MRLRREKSWMATWNDVRRLALALPGTSEKTAYGKPAWFVGKHFFVWERPLSKNDIAALGSNAPSGAVLGVRTGDLDLKEALLRSDKTVFFTIPHFTGYPAVLVRLDLISKSVLKAAIAEAWLAHAPKDLADEFLRGSKRREKGTQ